ncbi:hypothetical protein EDC04DRAFT_2561287 [Pisolithus marmoratus]|nr:hypothetical protein EDC04DRAFT_2561287 [Pisolithus marmoratus]
MTDVLSRFGRLDELIQIIYQGFDRFVVLSQVNESAWTIHLALKGPGGRWWRGTRSAQDILGIVGTGSTPQVLDTFAETLSETIVNGELAIDDWSPEKGTKIKLTLGPTSKNPVRVPLVELSSTEAAAYATALLSEIALQAQPRRCRLNPPIFSATTPRLPPSVRAPSPHIILDKKDVQDVPSLPAEALRKIQILEAELVQAKAQKAKSKSPPVNSGTSEQSAVVAQAPKGASLANPHKKARKYQALEFASDEE